MLEIRELSKHHGARALLDAVSLRVDTESRVGLIGRNGEGKSTLLKIVAGLETSDSGRVSLVRGARVGYLRQELDPEADMSVLDAARQGQARLQDAERRLRALEAEMEAQGRAGRAVTPELSSRYASAEQEFSTLGGFAGESDLRGTLTGLGLIQSWWDRPLRELSGGWLMRVELAKLLLARPEILLLDEPTNHLDLATIEWFEMKLQEYPGGVVVVSHDRAFLNRHATQIADLRSGKLYLYKGNYTSYLAQRELAANEVQARRTAIEKQIEHAAAFVERFGAKNTKATQAESRKKQIAKLEAELETLPVESARPMMRFKFPPAPRSGEVALRLEGVSLAYGDRTIYQGIDLELRRGERVALIGPNGSGKSTLLRILAGTLTPDRGAQQLGHNVKLAYYAQHQSEALDDSLTVYQEIEHDAPYDAVPMLRSLLGAFLFRGDDIQKPVRVLSGGERARLALAKLMLRGANVLVLDEPTNHLDIPAIEVISQALKAFEGTIVLISHDREFIDSIAGVMLEVRPGPQGASLHRHVGNYDAYLRKTTPQPAGPTAAPFEPTRSRTEAPAGSSATAASEPSRGGLSKNALRKLREDAQDIERHILETETQIEQLDQLLAHPTVARDGNRLREISTERAERATQLEELYASWQELEDEIQAAGAGR